MSSLIDAFVLDRKSQGMTPKTIRWHETSLLKFSSYLESIGDVPPSEWTASTLRGFTIFLQEQDLSPASVRTHVNSIWAFARWLFEEEIIDVNIAEKAKKPRVPKKQKTSFTATEMKAMLDAASTTLNRYRDVAILYIMFDTGMRAQEVCNLTVGDFHSAEGILMVRSGKGQKDRVTPISSKTSIAIHRYLGKHRSLKLDKHEPLFLNKRHGALTPSGLIQLVKRIAKKSGVQGVHPHRFRHSSALHFLRNGGDALTLQRILGHSTLDMTNKYVAMLSDDLTRVHSTASPVKNLK